MLVIIVIVTARADPLVLRPLPDDGGPDIADYNSELTQRENPSWYDVAWLYAECYLCNYKPPRRVTTASRRGKGRHVM